MSQVQIRAAMDTALNAMPGIIPAASISTSNGASPSVFDSGSVHNFITGMTVKMAGHSTLTDAPYVVASVPSSNLFTLKNAKTGAAISVGSGSGGVATPQLTAWENVSFAPQNEVPYQKVNYIFARPENPTMGDSFYRERGYMQITLYYAPQKGSYAAMSRAELIRSTFPRGASFSSGGVKVNVDRTPEIITVGTTDESYIVVVRIPFYADI